MTLTSDWAASERSAHGSRPRADVPDRGKPAVIVFELSHGRYEQVAHVTGDDVFAAVRPFPVCIVPSQLVVRLPR